MKMDLSSFLLTIEQESIADNPSIDTETLSDEWVCAHLYDKSEGSFDHWSVNYVIELFINERYQDLWEFIQATFRRDLPDNVLSILASGALEDLLVGAGEMYIDQITSLASEDLKFRQLLNEVWQNDMPDELWTQVCQLRESGF